MEHFVAGGRPMNNAPEVTRLAVCNRCGDDKLAWKSPPERVSTICAMYRSVTDGLLGNNPFLSTSYFPDCLTNAPPA